MNHGDFLSTKNLESAIINCKKTVDDEPINWLQMRWIRLERMLPYTLQYKTTFSEDFPFFRVNLKKSGVGRQAEFANIKQDNLYPSVRPITKENRADLMSLLKYIPPVHHYFYKNLVTTRETHIGQESENYDILYCDDCVLRRKKTKTFQLTI